jgi:hypothetical protein
VNAARECCAGALSFQIEIADFVMAGLVPAIHVFFLADALKRGCPRQARA